MGRWQPDAQGRLQQAALELYGERGFEPTTVADIAERAGLTERTFFRYFADKREVLFLGSGDLLALFAKTVEDAPDSVSPMDAVAAALESASDFFEERRAHSGRRLAVIAANPSLQERELIKMASLAAAVAEALRSRGVTEPTATLTAEVGIAVFKVGFEIWVDEGNDRGFAQVMQETMGDLRAVLAP
jgi:AcrR family transcriptional regulator